MPRRLEIKAGAKFGYWTVLKEGKPQISSRHRKRTMVVVCVCGFKKTLVLNNLLYGVSRSCGCKTVKLIVLKTTKHGMAHHPMYGRWLNMRQRCYNKKNPAYADYGGRGIRICRRWRKGEDGKSGFQCFYEDMGDPPFEGAELDRKNNDKGYSPGNCRWIAKIKNNSNKRSNVKITLSGKTRTAAQWSRVTGIPEGTIIWRVKRGWSVETALTKSTRG